LASAFLGSIAVIVFGAMGDSRAWMPDWQNNYLSWSFAFAVIGVFAEYVAGILFLVEARIQGKQRKMRESHSAYTMETKAWQLRDTAAAGEEAATATPTDTLLSENDPPRVRIHPSSTEI